MKIFTGVIIAVLLVMPTQARTALSIVGVVMYVSDGDTIWVKPEDGSEALDVRIQGIDAPESCQEYGHVSKQALSQHLLRKTVTLTTKARDKYGRVIARVSFGGRGNQDVGAWMVVNGHAWSYHFHRNAGPYAREEMAARQAGRGLWINGNPIEPREYRRRTKCHKPHK
jgi:micrococcal nuclease